VTSSRAERYRRDLERGPWRLPSPSCCPGIADSLTADHTWIIAPEKWWIGRGEGKAASTPSCAPNHGALDAPQRQSEVPSLGLRGDSWPEA